MNYYIDRIEKKGLPTVQLSVDDTISREKLYREFTRAYERFGLIETPIERLVFEIFGKNKAVVQEAVEARSNCNYTLRQMPRKVPNDIHEPYFIALERITYLCKALDVALVDNTTENYFYAIKLMTTGKMIEEILRSGETLDETGSPYTLSKYVTIIIEYLTRQADT